MLGARHFFFSSRHRDVRHRTTAVLFQLKFSHHRISATAAPQNQIFASHCQILGAKIRAIQKLPLQSRIFNQINAHHFLTKFLLSLVSSLWLPVFCLLSLVSCLLYNVFCLMSPV